MKRIVLTTILMSLTLAATVIASSQELKVRDNTSSVALAFTENQGQWDKSIKFRADAGGATMWFTEAGVYYQFSRNLDDGSAEFLPDRLEAVTFTSYAANRTQSMMVRTTFVGADHSPRILGKTPLDYRCNYFVGNDPGRWRTDVANFAEIVYEDVYPGIDLKYYGNGQTIKYDFVVSPGADPSRIRIQYDGVENISINDRGELVIKTRWTDVIERRPEVYQPGDDILLPTSARYKLIADNSFGFELTGEYDPSLPLVIDPVLSYSTYLGGGENDCGLSIAVDESGAMYIAGSTRSADFPLLDPYQDIYHGTEWSHPLEAFVTKIGDDGALVYSTYLGGERDDHCSGIAVDGAGQVYVTGLACSPDFPTFNAFQNDFAGIDGDAFVTKLSSEGNSLVYSTYLGGGDSDQGESIAIDEFGAAYITGFTWSLDFPKRNPLQTYTGDGASDVFVAKLNATGTNLDYSTYLGGPHFDFAYGIAVDATGAAYVTGWTYSSEYPTFNAYQDENKGEYDGFITKLSSAGDALVYSTYLGGTAKDWARDVAVDASGAVYVVGTTVSADFPMAHPFQDTPQGETEVFVTKVGSSGTVLEYSTYLGGSGGDLGYDIAVDTSGIVYLVGLTESADFPIVNSIHPYQANDDAFVAVLDNGGSSLVASTYLGGSGDDAGRGIALGSPGEVYIAGGTGSTNFPLLNPSMGYQGETDAFVTRLTMEPMSCCQLPGDADHSGQVNLLDMQYLRNYLHKGGPEPPCMDEADVNGDGEVTTEDMSCVARFLFSSGNPCVFVECP